MLVLERMAHQSVLVGDDIEVTVLKIMGGVVRLGFEAPKNVRILREEVLLKEKMLYNEIDNNLDEEQ